MTDTYMLEGTREAVSMLRSLIANIEWDDNNTDLNVALADADSACERLQAELDVLSPPRAPLVPS